MSFGAIVIDQSPVPLLHRHPGKIQEQPYWLLHESKIGQQLLGMQLGQLLDRLDLDNQAVLGQQINPERGIDFQAILPDRDWNLPSDRQAFVTQALVNRLFVDTFGQARSRFAADADGLANDDR